MWVSPRFEMSKPSIRTGSRSSPSASWSADERLGPLLAAVLAPQPVLGEREVGVPLGQLAQPPQIAARGHPDLHLRVALARERLGEHLRPPAQFGADDDAARDRRSGAVVLEQEGLGDLAGVAVLVRAVLLARQVEALPLGQHTVAHLEDLGVGVGALDRHPDHVGASQRTARHLLALHQAADGVQPVAEERRPLEVLRLGRLLHLVLEVAGDLLVAAGEEADDPVDVAPVLLLVDVADAGRLAALDVVVEAGHAGAPARLRPLAGAVLEELPEQVEGLPHPLGGREGAEVGAVRPVPLAGEVDARELLVEADPDVGIRLVVPQPDVETRPVALDEALLGEQRLGLGLRDEGLDRLGSADQLGRPAHARPPAAALAGEVRRDPLADRVRLAHVEGAARLVAEDVDAGGVWQLAPLVCQFLAALGHYPEGRVLAPPP